VEKVAAENRSPPPSTSLGTAPHQHPLHRRRPE
jgi:hypothetical protein